VTLPHPKVDADVAEPASANTVAKLSLGIADNHAEDFADQSDCNPSCRLPWALVV
jgi:flavoprotein